MPGHAFHGGSRRRWLVLAVSIGVMLSLVAALMTDLVVPVSGWGRGPAPTAGKPVPVHAVRGRNVQVRPMKGWHQPATAWPAAGSGTAVIAAAAMAGPGSSGPSALVTPGSGRAGRLPVWVGPPTSARARQPALTSAYTSAPLVRRVRVRMAPHALAIALGVPGAVFSVGRADGQSPAGQVHVSLDYSSFAHAYGGAYASRLRLVKLPACALTTPHVARCRKQVPLPAGSADSVRAGRVGADVTLPGAAMHQRRIPQLRDRRLVPLRSSG